MFITVTGTTDLLLAVTVTTLSVIVLVTSVIMGLKRWWFRTRMYNIQESKGSSEVAPTFGVYRGQSFEVASAAPKVHQPANATASSSSHKLQEPSSSKRLPPPSTSGHNPKSDSKKKNIAPSPEKPLMGQSQPSGSKQDKKDRNKSKHQSATPKNPLAKPDEHDKGSEALYENMKPRNEVPVRKSILQTELPPIPVTHYVNSSELELNHDNHTSHKPTHDNRTSRREIDDNHVSHKSGRSVPVALKSKAPKAPIPQYVTEQDESESET
jgi:hypothetical protein